MCISWAKQETNGYWIKYLELETNDFPKKKNLNQFLQESQSKRKKNHLSDAHIHNNFTTKHLTVYIDLALVSMSRWTHAKMKMLNIKKYIHMSRLSPTPSLPANLSLSLSFSFLRDVQTIAHLSFACYVCVFDLRF